MTIHADNEKTTMKKPRTSDGDLKNSSSIVASILDKSIIIPLIDEAPYELKFVQPKLSLE